ncbi:MAG TPA: surface-adhesin E family protein [Longimicrobium sp.]|nr:surface-adhesin E family protein [Longimicrobium sp.]
MRHLAIILSALLLPVAACGQRAPTEPWVLLYRATESVVWVDSSRIARGAQGTEVWVRVDYTTPERVPGDPGRMFSRVEILHRIDCAAGTVSDLRMRLSDPEGRLLSDEPAETRWNTIREHPLGQTIFPRLCAWLSRRRS